MAADLRERVARAIARDENGDETGWQAWRNEADAVLAELAPELAPQAEPVAWAMADQLDDKLMIGFSVVRTGHPDQKRGHFTVPLYAAAPQPQPQASAEDVRTVWEFLNSSKMKGREHDEVWSAFYRIRASLGVGRE